MPRGDELNDELRFSDRDDDADDIGYGGGSGSSSYDDDDEEGPDLLRVRMTATAARSFVARATQVVAGGRPPCPLCGAPLDPRGHICPRRNGHYVN